MKHFFLKTVLNSIVLFLVLGCSESAPTIGTKVDNIQPQISSRTVLNGRYVTDEEAKVLGGVFLIHMNKRSSCTAVHLGRGVILTAYHCIDPKAKPQLLVYTPSTKTMYDVGTSYSASQAPEESAIPMGNRHVPQPDLTLVRLQGKAAQVIGTYPTTRLSSSPLKTTKNAMIAGYGREDFSEEQKSGKLKIGKVMVSAMNDILYQLKFQTGDNFSAGLPGDSGGPLLETDSGNILVYGIASVLSTDKERTRGGNLYARVDTSAVRDWIISELRK